MTYTPTPAFPPEYTALIDPHGTIDELTRLRAQVAQLQRALAEVQDKTALYIVDITQERDKWRNRAMQAENDITQIRAGLANVELITRKYARR